MNAAPPANPPLLTPLGAKERLMNLLPMLCLVHCVGTALLASLMPAAALWLNSEWLEGPLSLLSALLIGTLVLRLKPSQMTLVIRLLFGLVVGLGAIGWIWNSAWLRHGSLLLLVGVQLLWLRERRVQHRHDHHHVVDSVEGAGGASCTCH